MGSYDDSRTLDIIVHDKKIYRNREMAQKLRLPQVLPSLSLERLLQHDSKSLNLYHKIVLALNLSHTLLRMHQDGMTSKWSSEAVYFLFNEKDSTLDEAYNPYIPYTLTSTDPSKTESLSNGTGYPLLVAFGKLLLEIALGRLLNETELSIQHRSDIALMAIVIEENLSYNVPPGYYKATEMCIESNQGDDDYDSDGSDANDEHDGEARFQTILSTAIAHLESDRDYFQRSAYIDYKVKISKDLPGTAWMSRAYSAPISDRNQLFDEGGGRTKVRGAKADSADSFMNLATQFYENHIKNLSATERISIAILDTGVNQSDNFIRAKCREIKSDRAGQSPIKVTKSFVAGPLEDELGHGTDVAALILKLAPNADLYIAKISRLREEAGTSHIAKAIDWAHKSGVNIINMSFGMREHNEEIEAAIRRAENDGIIIFAAASNDGANTDRAFPARMDKVICIHASDGKGNRSDFNPTARSDCQNFCTLGESIQSPCEKGGYISGTSYATPVSAPVAAAFAANALMYVRNCSKLTDEYRKRAFNREGMKNILIAMSHERDSYFYIIPWRKMWGMDEDDTVEAITLRIKDALKMSR